MELFDKRNRYKYDRGIKNFVFAYLFFLFNYLKPEFLKIMEINHSIEKNMSNGSQF